MDPLATEALGELQSNGTTLTRQVAAHAAGPIPTRSRPRSDSLPPPAKPWMLDHRTGVETWDADPQDLAKRLDNTSSKSQAKDQSKPKHIQRHVATAQSQKRVGTHIPRNATQKGT